MSLPSFNSPSLLAEGAIRGSEPASFRRRFCSARGVVKLSRVLNAENCNTLDDNNVDHSFSSRVFSA